VGISDFSYEKVLKFFSNIAEYIQPAKLPVKSDSYATYGGESAIASGWGKISDCK